MFNRFVLPIFIFFNFLILTTNDENLKLVSTCDYNAIINIARGKTYDNFLERFSPYLDDSTLRTKANLCLGYAALEKNMLKEAQSKFDLAIKNNQSFKTNNLHSHIASLYFKKKKRNLAQKHFKRALLFSDNSNKELLKFYIKQTQSNT